MNADFLNILNAGTSMAESLMGEAFTYQGVTYSGIFAQGQLDVTMLLQGYNESCDYTLRCTKSQFAAKPEARKSITKGALELFIKGVDEDAMHYILQLTKRP